jgi:hypothetical protein
MVAVPAHWPAGAAGHYPDFYHQLRHFLGALSLSHPPRTETGPSRFQKLNSTWAQNFCTLTFGTASAGAAASLPS